MHILSVNYEVREVKEGFSMGKFLLEGLFYSVFFATALTLMMVYFDDLTY